MRQLSVCNDTYTRDVDGAWKYPWGQTVPGAADLTLSDLMAMYPDTAVYERMEQFRPLSAAELEWLSGGSPDQDQLLIRRRNGRTPHSGDLVVGIQAPELHVMAMMTVTEVAESAGVTKTTIDSYRYRGYLPQPQVVRGRTPLWSRPIVEYWLTHRPGPGWRSDVYSDGQEEAEPPIALTGSTLN